MLYKITNISSTNLSVEPPSLLHVGKSVTREYPPGIFPKRVENFQKHGMIEICPISNKVKKKEVTHIEIPRVYTSIEVTHIEIPRVYTSINAILPDPKNYKTVPFIENNEIEIVDITGLFE